jgi:hypothetical protein
MMTRLDLTPMQHATLLGLVGLAIAVMQNDETQGRAFVVTLTQPGVEETAKEIVEMLNGAEPEIIT